MSSTSTNTLWVVLGPTAIGKTALGIQLAQKLKTEIISCDSRQFFQEMRIGTAVPSTEELDSVPHHFIQHISIHQEYSVGSFEKESLKKIEELFQTKLGDFMEELSTEDTQTVFELIDKVLEKKGK